MKDKVKLFRQITERMANTYEAKNHDYGDSFGKTIAKYGNVAFLTRFSDKFNRIERLVLSGKAEVAESLLDTVLDAAAYAIMFASILKRRRNA